MAAGSGGGEASAPCHQHRRRYRRQDEAGTPFAITIDGQSLAGDTTVTVRDRDTLLQERVASDQLAEYLAAKLGR
jgi:glycyl-tRNA synthetase